MKIILTYMFVLLPFCVLSQTYSGPESVEYDYANGRWLIANTTSHQVLSRNSAGVLTVFASGFSSGPYGIEIVGDTLFCCSGGFVKGYDINNGSQVFNLNLSAGFLNGITHDNNGNLFATDFSAKKIFKIDIAAQTFSAIATGLVQSPNGIIFDAANDRCIFVNWGSNAPIKALDVNTNVVSVITTTTLSNCDGIAVDGSGNYYVSNWGNQSVVKFNNVFSGSPVTVASGLNNPADVFYNVTGDTLGIPNAGNNTVSFVGFTNTAMNDVSLKNEIAFSPNPALRHEKISFKIKTPSPVKIDLIDLNGKQIGEVFNSNGKLTSGSFLVLPSDKLESGIYFLKTNTLQKTYLEKIVIL